MSDPRYMSSPPRPPAASLIDSTRPDARFYRARIVEIKRRGPSAQASPIPAVQQQPSMDSASYRAEQRPRTDSLRYRASPPARLGARETASMSSSPRRARDYAPHGNIPAHDVPPPPPPTHSPSQRSVSIAQGSYMDYVSDAPPSRTVHASQSYQQSTPPPRPRLRRQEYDLRGSPTTALRNARGIQDEAEEELTPHQSAPPPVPRRRYEEPEEYDPRRLLPTAVRPPQAFQFELEEEPPQHSSSQLDIPGRFPSSPDTMDVEDDDLPTDSQMDGLQEHMPKLRPQAGSYRELQPYEIGMIYSNPGPYQTPAPPSNYIQQNSDAAEPFLYEIRSPRKGDHDGRNKAAASSKKAAYSARNPLQEAEMYPLLRRLGGDERYATSFRTERHGIAGHTGVMEREAANGHGGDGVEMVEVKSPGSINGQVIDMEGRRAERRYRR